MVTGAIYSIMAAGLVLTYETSGVFNFAHAAVAFCSAYFYYQLNTGQSIPIVPSAILTVGIFAPLLGLALDRMVFGRLSTAPMYARIVGTIGVLIALPNFMLWLIDAVFNNWLHLHVADLSKFGSTAGFNPPGIGPTPPHVFDLGWAGLHNVHLTSDQLVVFIVGALIAVLLYVVIRRTRVGLEMRSQVDRAPLATLRGIDPSRTSGVAWTLSMTLAGLGGVLIAPLFQLDSDTFTLVVFASLAAVAVAGVRSIPIAFLGGLGLGVLQNMIAGYQTEIFPRFLSRLSGLQSAVPYVVLLIALFVLGRNRGRAAGSVSEERPAPDPRDGLPSWRRKLPWVIVGALLVLYTLGALPWPTNPSFVRSNLLAPGLALAIVFLSFVVVTGIGGMVSLAQATFVTTGGFAAGWALQTTGANHPPPWASWKFDIPVILHHGQLNFMVACLIGAAAAAALGAIVAFSVRRMGALELALATFALAWVAYFIGFENDGISNTASGYTFRSPTWSLGFVKLNFSNSKSQTMLMLILFGVITLLIYNLQKSASGRALYAVRSSSVAARTAGISPARAYVTLFALSAGIAGFGGAMYGLTTFTITRDTAPPLVGLTWLAVAVTFGVRRPGGALLAGLAYTSGTEIWHEISIQSWMPSVVANLTTSTYFLPMLFGLGAVNLAKNPDGLLAMGWQGLMGRDRLEQRRVKAREAHIAQAESAVHGGEEESLPVGVSEGRVLEVVGDGAVAKDGEPATPPVLLLDDVVAGYGDVEVLHGVSVAVEPGQIVALLGANGAGKSTLCNVAAGAVPLTAGQVTISGEDVSDLPPFNRVRRGLLLVPEARGVFPGLTVEENLQVLLRDPTLRDKAYERFPILGQRRKQLAGLLSGGEQQMLSLAPALVDPPAVFVADEPTLGLAPLSAAIVLDALRELRSKGSAVLLVEEKASEVMKVADIVAFLRLGRLVWIGRREDASQEQLAMAYLGGAPAAGPAV
jgi:ABC-type branched-subunit amino acid transport system ATPase component/branched-subunit amino acid ABC-type transport system permease component